jgi:para-nitrobenzyl esterase
MIQRRTLFGAMAGHVTAKAKAQSMTDAPIASTAHGHVRDATDEGIYVFKGIPYGAPTASAARFRAARGLERHTRRSGLSADGAAVDVCPWQSVRLLDLRL